MQLHCSWHITGFKPVLYMYMYMYQQEHTACIIDLGFSIIINFAMATPASPNNWQGRVGPFSFSTSLISMFCCPNNFFSVYLNSDSSTVRLRFRLRRIMLAKSWKYAFMDSRIMLAKSSYYALARGDTYPLCCTYGASKFGKSCLFRTCKWP